jgi:hypothetical protein
MKTYKNISDCIHAFAQQEQSSGKSGNVFFEYKKLYSYGYHFCLAEFLTENVVLLNNTSYSNTTSKHQNKTLRATFQYIQILTSTYYIENVNRSLEHLKNNLSKAKKPEIYLNEAFNLIKSHESANEIYPNVENYNYLKEKPIFDAFKAFFQSVENSAKLKAYKQKQALKEQQNKTAYIEAFKNYQPFEALKNKLSKKIDLIRISKDGKHIETSQSVKIPISEALVYYRELKNGNISSGYKIGDYTVSKISDTNIQIGCHVIALNEIETTLKEVTR